MRTIYSDRHALRDARTELNGGLLQRPFECPKRAQIVLDAVRAAKLGPIDAPAAHDLAAARSVHDPAYLHFLETAWGRWVDAGFDGEAIPTVFPVRRSSRRLPRDIEGALGYFALAAETAITEGTWQAALAAKDVAQTAAELLVQGERQVFALCRPPGHHAGRDLFGGYCFLNNAAIAAAHLRTRGLGRVAVLDVDFHHGNGTQDIFATRADVLFVSWHGDPDLAFPHFWGWADERGLGPGEGFTHNYPLPAGTDWARFAEALRDGLAKVRAFGADAVVVSLGLDTFKDDPLGFFELTTDDFRRLGSALATLRLPTLYVLEGGYAVAALGRNVVATLEGHLGG